MSWIDEGVKEGLPEAGNFLTIVEGTTYLLRFTDLENDRQGKESIKPNMKGELKPRYTFYVEVIGIQEKQDLLPVIEKCLKRYPKKKDRYVVLKENLQQEYAFEMSKTCRFHLAEFAKESNLKNGEAFTFQRIGNNSFIFQKVSEKG